MEVANLLSYGLLSLEGHYGSTIKCGSGRSIDVTSVREGCVPGDASEIGALTLHDDAWFEDSIIVRFASSGNHVVVRCLTRTRLLIRRLRHLVEGPVCTRSTRGYTAGSTGSSRSVHNHRSATARTGGCAGDRRCRRATLLGGSVAARWGSVHNDGCATTGASGRAGGRRRD
jgi:hypothetical protein